MKRLALLAFAAALATTAIPALAQTAPAPSAWTNIAPMPQAQVEAGAVLLDGKIYVTGGWKDETAPWGEVQVYDVASNTWSVGVPLPEPIHHHGVVTVGGKIYAIGGFTKPFPQREPLDTVYIFDPKTRQWSKGAPMPAPAGAGVAAVVGTTIYYAGGERRRAPGGPPPKKGSHPAYEPITDLVAYDTVTNTWKKLAPMKVARDHAMVGAVGGKFYVIGGRDRPYYNLVANEEFDPATGAWTSRAELLNGRSGGAAGVLNGKIYVFGGEGNFEVKSGVFPQAEAYDPATDTWVKFADMPVPRHSIVAIGAGAKIYLPGGATKRGGSEVTANGDAFEVK